MLAVDAVHRADQQTQGLELVDIRDAVALGEFIERHERRGACSETDAVALKRVERIPYEPQMRIDFRALLQRRRIERRILVLALLEPFRLRAPLQAPAERDGQFFASALALATRMAPT